MVWLNEKGRLVLQDRTIDVGEGIGRLVQVDIDADGDLDLLAAGLDRATGRADLLLFMNTLRRR